MSSRHLLLVEDEELLAQGLKHSLEQEGFTVTTVGDGNSALELASEGSFDLILLDLMLPGIDGVSVCREIRKNSMIPIIMLTARSGDIDKILGLEFGADDYVTKPFNTRELVARINALLRRAAAQDSPETAGQQDDIIEAGPITLNLTRRETLIDGNPVELTAKEFDMLTHFLRHPGRVFTRQNLSELVWGFDYLGDSRTVDVHIHRLREKIEEDAGSPRHLKTKWGVGYYFVAR